MMIKQQLLTCVAVGATFISFASANARNFLATFTGTVADGFTLTSAAGGSDLSGDAFTATFLFNPAMGGVIDQSPVFNDAIGGSANGTPSPVLGATLMIDGLALPVLAGYADAISIYNDSNTSQLLFSATSATTDLNTYINTMLDFELYGNFNIPASFISFDGPITEANTNSSAEYSLSSGNTATGDFAIVYADLVPTHLTVAAVPEPASWAMMLIGFGVAGAALRRGKVVTRVHYAHQS